VVRDEAMFGKEDVLAYFDPDDDTVTRASGDGPGQILEDERRDKAVGDGWTFTGRAGFPLEANCRSGRKKEDAVYHLCAEWVLRD